MYHLSTPTRHILRAYGQKGVPNLVSSGEAVHLVPYFRRGKFRLIVAFYVASFSFPKEVSSKQKCLATFAWLVEMSSKRAALVRPNPWQQLLQKAQERFSRKETRVYFPFHCKEHLLPSWSWLLASRSSSLWKPSG